MNITKKQNGSALVFALEGRLDTATAPELEQEVKTGLDGVTELTFNFENLEYISSAGLRVLLTAKKRLHGIGPVKVTHCNEMVKEVFAVTGFDQILTLE